MTDKPLIDQIREVLREDKVLTPVTLQERLPNDDDFKTIRLHLLTLLEHDEIAVVNKIAGQMIIAYVWKDK